jgi:hypothetical protein
VTEQPATGAQLLAPLSGAVVEIGAGDGRNFARYPPAVTQVTAVEPGLRLRARAIQAATAAPVPVTVVPGTAHALPVPDASRRHQLAAADRRLPHRERPGRPGRGGRVRRQPSAPQVLGLARRPG